VPAAFLFGSVPKLFGSVQMNGAYQRRLGSVKTAFVAYIGDTAITSYGKCGLPSTQIEEFK